MIEVYALITVSGDFAEMSEKEVDELMDVLAESAGQSTHTDVEISVERYINKNEVM